MRAEKNYDSHYTTISQSQIAVKPTPDSRNTATLEETIYNNNIGKIVKSLAGDREKIIEELSKLPISELQEDKTNVYLCKLAIEHKKDNENKTYVDKDKILNALKSVRKNTNSSYISRKKNIILGME